MAEEKILISVDVDTEKMAGELSKAIEGVAALKQEQRDLRREIESGNDVNGEFAKRLVQVSADLERNQRAVKSQTAVMQAATAAGLKQNASLDEQRQYLNTLQKAYANLEGEAKELADAEGGMRDQIKALNDSLVEQEHQLGQNGRNVGNYKESIIEAAKSLGPMKGLLEGVAGGGTEMSKSFDRADKVAKGLMANPLWGTFFLLGGILSTIAAKLKQNEEAMQGVQTLTAGIGASLKQLKPLLDWLMKYLVDNLLKALDWVMETVKSILGWVDRIAQKFGKSLNLAGAFEEGAAAARDMAEAEEESADRIVKAEEDKTKKLAALREELKKRRMDDMERELYEIQKQAEQELQTAELTAEEIAEIQAYYAQKTDEIRQKYADAEKKRQDEAAARAEEEARKAEEAEKQKLESRQRARQQFGIDPELSPEEKELQALEIARENDLLNAEEYEIAKTLISEKYSKKRQDEIEAEVAAATALYEKSVKDTGNATASALSALSELLGEYAETSEAAAKAQKAFAFGSILVNQAMSIAEGAKGIAAAMAGAAEAAAATGPAAPFTLIAYEAQMVGQVLAVVASVASTIVQAKQIFSQAEKHATGALIPGNYDGKDDVPAWLSKGELVLNPKQATTALWNMANNPMQSFAYERMAAAIAEGMAAAPAPVVVYQELQEYGQKVANFDELAAI